MSDLDEHRRAVAQMTEVDRAVGCRHTAWSAGGDCPDCGFGGDE